MEICTSEGFVTIAVAEGEGEPSHSEKPSCPFCAVASTTGAATLSTLQSAQVTLYNARQYNEKLVYEVVLSRAFQSGLNTPLRAPPIYS